MAITRRLRAKAGIHALELLAARVRTRRLLMISADCSGETMADARGFHPRMGPEAVRTPSPPHAMLAYAPLPTLPTLEETRESSAGGRTPASYRTGGGP